MASWLVRVLSREPGHEAELVERYSRRLVAFAQRQLPARVAQRVDAEDVVQSVYRSFFRRLNEGRFVFEDSHDLWRLLAAMTFHKARNAVKFHQRNCRDVRRDTPLDAGADSRRPQDDLASPEPGSEDLELLWECLEQLLVGLPDASRQIVVRRLEGQSIEQIVQEVKRSRSTVLRTLAGIRVLASHQLESAE